MGDAAYFGADCFLRRIIPGLGEGTLKVIFRLTSYCSSLIIVHPKFHEPWTLFEKCLINRIGQCSISRRILKEFKIIVKTDKMLIWCQNYHIFLSTVLAGKKKRKSKNAKIVLWGGMCWHPRKSLCVHIRPFLQLRPNVLWRGMYRHLLKYDRPNVGTHATKWWQCGTCWGILGDNPLDWRINTLDPLLLATIVEI